MDAGTIELGGVMKRALFRKICAGILGIATMTSAGLAAQEAKPSPDTGKPAASPADSDRGHEYSGMYSFRKDGEFVQVSVADADHVTGFVSRFGDGESDKGAFLDQYFKTAKLDGTKLAFTTEIVHGTSFDFKGTIERGEGKNPGDEAYYVLKGTLTENISDVNKKVTSHAQEVALKMFPQDASPAAVERK